MLEAAVNEFPFVATLTTRQKSKVARLWDHFKEVKTIMEEKGVVVPQHLIARMLGVSRQRIGQIIDDGRLECVEIGGVRYVTERSVVAFAKLERPVGGPRKMPTYRETMEDSKVATREILEKVLK